MSRYILIQNDGCIRVQRVAHETLNSSCIAPTVQASAASFTVCGCFCLAGLCIMYCKSLWKLVCSNKMKSADYVWVLNWSFHSWMNFNFPEGEGVHDNASKIVKDCPKSTSYLAYTWIGHCKVLIGIQLKTCRIYWRKIKK